MTGEEYVEYTGKKYIVFLLEQTWLNGPVKKILKEVLKDFKYVN